MNSIFQACSLHILSRAGYGVARSSIRRLSFPSWKANLGGSVGIRAVNVEFPFTAAFRVQYYSTKRKEKKSPSVKLVPTSVIEQEEEEEKDSFFVVRKGDIIGVYKNFSDIQPQIGSSLIDPPVSVFKGFCLPKDAEEYFLSRGFRNALYSINAADFKDDILGPLQPCTIQDPSPTKGDEAMTNIASTKKMLEVPKEDAVTSCILHFDGASKGNPGPAGAGAILRNVDGSLICRVREGLGTVTNNVAEYRAVILGMKCALKNGCKNIKVLGDSKLVCMQIEQRWKVRNKNISILYSEAKKLKDEFATFEISHVLRSYNGDADAEANLGVGLADGEIQETIE